MADWWTTVESAYCDTSWYLITRPRLLDTVMLRKDRYPRLDSEYEGKKSQVARLRGRREQAETKLKVPEIRCAVTGVMMCDSMIGACGVPPWDVRGTLGNRSTGAPAPCRHHTLGTVVRSVELRLVYNKGLAGLYMWFTIFMHQASGQWIA